MPDSRLLTAFAAQEPVRFAALLTEGTAEDRLEVLSALPPDQGVAVAAQLDRRALMALPEELLVRLIEAGAFDDAAALLGRLTRQEALQLIEAVAQSERRRRLRQFFVFPAHSLGSITSAEFVQVQERATVREVLAVLTGMQVDRALPVMVVDGGNRLLGALDLWKLVQRVDSGGLARDCLRTVPGLRPELSIEAAAEQPDWADHDWLPVLDHEGRLVGVITRARLTLAGEPHRDAIPLGEGIVELGSQLVTVSADVLGELIGRDDR